MNVMSLENIQKSYTERMLLDGVSLGIQEGEKIGLIGVNGAGKTTLLRIIAGKEIPDGGQVIKRGDVRVHYLPQDPEFNGDHRVLEQVFFGEDPTVRLLYDYQRELRKESPSDKKIIALSGKIEEKSAWDLEKEAKGVLTRLGIYDFERSVGTLSGGEKKRIALASALIQPAELLILDEPTNHLDNRTIDWLESYLKEKNESLVMVTHDRYFLDRIATKIVEVEDGKIAVYEGNYSKYLEDKALRQEMAEKSLEKKKNLFRKELDWIRAGVQGRGTKQKARIQRFETLEEETKGGGKDEMDLSLQGQRLGKKVIEIKDLSLEELFGPFSYAMTQRDRIGMIGPNGSGKTTFLNILAGKQKEYGGEVEVGETVKIGFYAQETEEIPEDQRVLEYIRGVKENIRTKDGGLVSAPRMLERFLFPPETHGTYIRKLSGGERRRLYLLKILMEGPNVLFFDEPTNDLDIKTLTVLEDYLEEFPGALIVVSHDRYFLDRTVETIFSIEEGEIRKYPGSYEDYKRLRGEVQRKETVERKEEKAKLKKEEKHKKQEQKKDSAAFTGASVPDKEPKRDKDGNIKLSYMEMREKASIDDEIAALEKKLEEVTAAINESARDFERLQELLAEKARLGEALEEKMERWFYLNG